jgi:hypothetical protein
MDDKPHQKIAAQVLAYTCVKRIEIGGALSNDPLGSGHLNKIRSCEDLSRHSAWQTSWPMDAIWRKNHVIAKYVYEIKLI